MRRWILLSAVLLIAGIALIIASAAVGEGEVGVFLIFPFIVTHGWIGIVGSLLIFAGIVTAFIGFWTSYSQMGGEATTESTPQTLQKSYGGVVMIGPIPIVFGSNEKTARMMLLVAMAVLAAFVLIFVVLALAR